MTSSDKVKVRGVGGGTELARDKATGVVGVPSASGGRRAGVDGASIGRHAGVDGLAGGAVGDPGQTDDADEAGEEQGGVVAGEKSK